MKNIALNEAKDGARNAVISALANKVAYDIMTISIPIKYRAQEVNNEENETKKIGVIRTVCSKCGAWIDELLLPCIACGYQHPLTKEGKRLRKEKYPNYVVPITEKTTP